MHDYETPVIRMLQCGAKGYILKDCEPLELQMAIISLFNNGFFYSELVTGKMHNAINRMENTGKEINIPINFTER